MKRRSILIVGASLVLAGCSFHGGGGGPTAGALPAMSPWTDSIVSDAKNPKISGTYDGSAHWQEGSKSQSASLKMTLRQHGTKVSGAFDLTKNSHTSDLTFKGSITSKTAKEVKLTFHLYDPKGRSAQAEATIAGKRLTGDGNVPASRSRPSVYITFEAKKKAKHKH